MASGLRFNEFWKTPWGYPQAVAVNTGLIFVGWLLHVVQPLGSPIALSWPTNAIFLSFYALLLVVLYHFLRKAHLLRWLSGLEFAVTSIIFFVGLCAFAVLIPQKDPSSDSTWLTNVLASWPFLFEVLAILTSLGLVTLKRLFAGGRFKTMFLLNHSGLWLTIAGMTFGAGDLTRFRVEVNKNETTHEARLPFQVTLKDFTIEEYQPRVVVVDGDKTAIQEAAIGKPTAVLGHRLELLDFLPMAMPSAVGFSKAEMPGAVAAAKVRIDDWEGWVSNGNAAFDAKPIQVSERVFVGLTDPTPKRYLSKVVIHQDGKGDHPAVIEVNRPLKVGGWKIYQAAYDAKMGRWSTLSIFEAVRDPWLPVVYGGLVMMLIGLVLLLWEGLALGKEAK